MRDVVRAGTGRRPSLRRRLLLLLLLPMLILLTIDAVVTYGVALNYSNRVHDADLADDVRTLAQMFRSGEVSGDLPAEARFLIEYDPDSHNYYSVRSRRRGLLSGNGTFPEPPAPAPGAAPELFYSRLSGRTLRAASLSLRAPNDPGDVLTVTIAETLHDRQRRAREILLLAVPLQTILILGALSLMWLGINRGLRILQPLTDRLAAREQELEPITGEDVPVEILPLTRTIDGLFERLRAMLSLQERFIADAAHQLRTPLAGLRLHVDRARAATDPATVRDALDHIDQLTERTARTSTQLLALTRAQNPRSECAAHVPVDLARQIPQVVGQRVPEAIRAGIDLGYQGPSGPVYVLGDAPALQELLDNLIDNTLRYAGRGARATVSLLPRPDGGVLLQVEDTGPGVPAGMLQRLGERFFRAPDAPSGGTGLGLAIVQQIAHQHGAQVTFAGAPEGGLRISVRFPPPAKS